MPFFPTSLLALPILRWESPRALPAAIAIACGLTIAVVWLYPVQVRFVRRPWRWVMPGLRAAALAVLTMALARPVASRVQEVGKGGTVAMLIDRSASMNVVDTGRGPAELVALADSLGLLPRGVRGVSLETVDAARPGPVGHAATHPAPPDAAPPPTLAQLSDTFGQLRSVAQQAFRAQGDLDYSRVSGQGTESAQARLSESAGRLATLSESLARMARTAFPGQSNAALRDRLAAPSKLPLPDARGTWVNLARQRIEQAGSALSDFQVSSDARLYRVNPDVKNACDALRRHTRFQLACAALLRPDEGLVARLGDKTPVSGFAFADDLTPLGPLRPNPSADLAAPSGPAAPMGSDGGMPDSPGSDDDPTNQPPRTDASPLPAVSPNGGGTDLAGSIGAALARLNPHNVRAVVLFSDGREVGADVGRGTAPAGFGVPVFTVAMAPPAPPRDVTFEAVQMPRSAFVGETINVRATLRATGVNASPGDVRLQVGGGPVYPPKLRGPADSNNLAEFSVKLEQPGTQQITLSIPPALEEASKDNNTAVRWVKVLPEKIRVAAYAGAPGWDFQLLRSALSRTPWVRLEAGVLDLDHPKLPLTPEQILQQDVLVLDDVPAGALDAEQWDTVYNKLVKERGGSVILVAGSDNAILGYGQQIAAASLLPFDPMRVKPAWKIWPGEKPDFHVVPAPGWERSDFGAAMRLDSADTTLRRWLELPPIFRLMPVPERLLRANARPILIEAEPGSSAGPAAGAPTPDVSTPDVSAPGVATSGVARSGDSAVLSETRPGLGRSLLLGTDETWRWRLGAGERLQDRFWVQLVRYAAEEPYAVRRGPVALDVDAVTITRGDRVRVRARLYDAALQSAADALPDAMRLEVLAGDRVVRSLPLSQPLRDSGRWEAILGGLDEGEYRLRLMTPPIPVSLIPPDDAPGPLVVTLHVTGGMEAELRDLTGDTDRLRRLAESTGGEMLSLDQIAGLPDRLANLGESRPRITQMPLWDSPYLFAFVVACLAAEWALRKRFGLS